MSQQRPVYGLHKILLSFFSYLEKCQFVQAQRVLDVVIEQQICQMQADPLIPSLLTFVVCESTYFSLSYLRFKFLQPDFISNLYNEVFTEINKIVRQLDEVVALRNVNTALHQSTPDLPICDTNSGNTTFQAATIKPTPATFLESATHGLSQLRVHSSSWNPSVLTRSSATLSSEAASVRTPTTPAFNLPKEETAEYFYFLDLFKQLCLVVHNRAKLISIYANLRKRCKISPDLENIIDKLVDFERQIPEVIIHPLLLQTRYNLLTEVCFLQRLLRLDSHISNTRFPEAFVTFCQCDAELNAFKQKFVAENESGTILDTQLFRWLYDYYACLSSKFTFYFWNLLVHEDKMRVLKITESDNEYISQMKEFVSRSKASHISLLIQPPSWETLFRGNEFDEKEQAVSRLETIETPLPETSFTRQSRDWYCSFSFPQERINEEDWKVVVSLLLQKYTHSGSATPPSAIPKSSPISTSTTLSPLLTTSSPHATTTTGTTVRTNSAPFVLCRYEDKTSKTYFLAKLELRMFLVLVYNCIMEETDPHVTSFIKRVRDAINLVTL